MEVGFGQFEVKMEARLELALRYVLRDNDLFFRCGLVDHELVSGIGYQIHRLFKVPAVLTNIHLKYRLGLGVALGWVQNQRIQSAQFRSRA